MRRVGVSLAQPRLQTKLNCAVLECFWLHGSIKRCVIQRCMIGSYTVHKRTVLMLDNQSERGYECSLFTNNHPGGIAR